MCVCVCVCVCVREKGKQIPTLSWFISLIRFFCSSGFHERCDGKELASTNFNLTEGLLCTRPCARQDNAKVSYAWEGKF